MRIRNVALSAVAVVALALASVSCNFMMPTTNYPVMRQEKEFILLESYRIPFYDSIDGLGFGFVALDGASSLSGAGSPLVYLSLKNQYQSEGKIFFLSPGSYIPLERGIVSFNESLISIDNGTGFLTEDGGALVNIDRNLGELRSTPLPSGPTLNDIEIAAPGSGELRGFAGSIFALAGYRAVFDNGTDLFSRSTDLLPNTAPLAIFVNGRNVVSASFTELTDSAYPDSSFWNPGGYEVRKSGFSESGAFTWIEAVRADNIRDIEEVKLVALMDNGFIHIKDLEAAGSAGDYVLAWSKREAPGFELTVLSGELNEIHSFSIYGKDAAYLGEAHIAQPSGMVRSALFAVLGTSGSSKDGEGMAVISLYAYPVSLLDGSAP